MLAGNLFDYLDWRGDLGLEQSTFNAVDSLILSTLSYIPFDGIVPEEPLRRSITVSRAAELFARQDISKLPVRDPRDVDLLAALASTKRFGSMELAAYVNRTDLAEEKQFSAVTVLTARGEVFIAFRGTDLSLVGWKEDFNMSFLSPVPSQTEAVAYLERAAKHFRGKLRIGGHSKGGNLAVYAASFCPKRVQNRIIAVYNNDGPGFDSAVISRSGYRAVQDRLQAFIPQSSLIGMMLEHDEQYTVVQSTASGGIMQHSTYTWSLLGTDFIRMETVTNGSRFVDQTLKAWVGGMEPARREQFVDALFEIISATQATTLTELSADWLKHARAISRTLKNIDAPTRKMLQETLRLLLKSAGKNIPSMLATRKASAGPASGPASRAPRRKS